MHASSRPLELNTSGTRHDVRRLFCEHHDRLLSSSRIIGTFILPVIVFLFVGFSLLHPFQVFCHDDCDRLASIYIQRKRVRMILFITVYWYYWTRLNSGLCISRRRARPYGSLDNYLSLFLTIFTLVLRAWPGRPFMNFTLRVPVFPWGFNMVPNNLGSSWGQPTFHPMRLATLDSMSKTLIRHSGVL